MNKTLQTTRSKAGFTRTNFKRSLGGFTILFAVLTASLLLAIGMAIFNVTYKELILSSTARDSQSAVYAADTGIECALYWDANSYFATGTGQRTIQCAEQNALFTVYPTRPSTSTFGLILAGEGTSDPCVTIEVAKSEDPTQTTLISRGYNTCDENNPRRVERALRVSY